MLFERQTPPRFNGHGQGFEADTLVVIYSCRKNTDTRIDAIRRTWVQDLVARGIPYLFLVGDGDDSIDGDVLALDVSDDYEDLPKKTLAMIDWVYANTSFRYLFKIDDDCHLDVARLLACMAYRKHHYYGRVLRRTKGDMNRAWHRSKSKTSRAQDKLDKSPEPSIYADGGGGYSLSRQAMHQVHRMRQTYRGQWLISVSLNEDKLVGDLLSLAGIAPSDEDYWSYQRRRTFTEAEPVGRTENLFYASASTPTVVTHLDSEQDFEHAQQISKSSEVWPKKIWPTCWPPSVAYNKDQLELLTDLDKFDKVLSAPVHVVSVLRNELTILPHFLAHYRRLGVVSFIVVDNLSEDGSREYLLRQPDVIVFSTDTEYKVSHYGVDWQQAVMGNLCLGKWVLLADADEFLVYPDCESQAIDTFIAKVEAEGADCVRVDMVDMYPFGDLDEADFDRRTPFEAAAWFDRDPFTSWRLARGAFSNAETYLSTFRHRIDADAEPNAFTSQKHPLFRYQSWMRFSQGVHDATGVKLSEATARFAHFKYHKDFKRKVETEVRRGQHFDNAKEYRRYAAMLAESNGYFGDKALSARYVNSSSFLSSGNKGHKA